jgi:peptidoglycan glycosyltransferase
MIRELKRVSLVVATMFIALFISASLIQAVDSEALAEDPRNVRSLYEGYKTLRGPILVDGKPIASSVEADDAYKYLRVYEDQMYSSVTGYFSVFRGATGVEAALNSYLSGQSSSQFFEKFNAVLSGNPVSGAAVELTIDPVMQQAAWDALGDLQGSVVVLDPATGNILAMVSKSSFDANELAGHENQVVADNYARLEADPTNPLINKTISGDLYHPGSVFKLVVAAAALESGCIQMTRHWRTRFRFSFLDQLLKCLTQPNELAVVVALQLPCFKHCHLVATYHLLRLGWI